jgi:hypothetical protein
MCSYMSSDSAPCLHARRQSKALNQWFEKLEMLTGMAQLDLLMRKDATEAGKDTFLKTYIIVVIVIITDHHLSSQSAYNSSIPISLPLALSVRVIVLCRLRLAYTRLFIPRRGMRTIYHARCLEKEVIDIDLTDGKEYLCDRSRRVLGCQRGSMRFSSPSYIILIFHIYAIFHCRVDIFLLCLYFNRLRQFNSHQS